MVTTQANALETSRIGPVDVELLVQVALVLHELSECFVGWSGDGRGGAWPSSRRT